MTFSKYFLCRSEEEEQHVNATYCRNLDDLLTQSDFVLLLTPLTKETRRMMGASQFKKMKSSAFLINMSRGRSSLDSLISLHAGPISMGLG